MRSSGVRFSLWGCLLVLVLTLAATGWSQAPPAVQYVYDDLGRLIVVIDTTSGAGREYVYDAVGNLLEIRAVTFGAVAIFDVSPSQGPVGTQVTVQGQGCSAVPSDNVLTFNGTPAPILNATSTSLTVTVPPGATTGPLAVTTPMGSATSSRPFTVLGTPTITDFSPQFGLAGTPVTLTGTDFFTPADANIITFHGTRAQGVIAGSAITLTTNVPSGATSGPIAVTTPAGTGVSSADFLVLHLPYPGVNLEFTGRIGIGQAETVTITKVNRIAILLFDGTAGQRVSLGLSNNTMGCVTVTLYNVHGTSLASKFTCSGNDFLDTLSLQVTGTYSLVVDPSGANTGSLTLTLFDVPPDVTGTVSIGGPGVPVSFTTPGQDALLTLSGTTGQRVSVVLNNMTIGCVAVALSKPDGTGLVSTFACGSNVFIDTVALPVTGTYTIGVNPSGAVTGSVMLTVYNVSTEVPGTIALGGAAVPVSISTPGQDTTLTFSGTAGAQVSVGLSNNSIGCLTVSVLKPDSTLLGSKSTCGSSDFLDNLSLPITGTDSVLLDPAGTNTGSVTVTLYNAMTVGGTAVPVTITTPGQNATLTFSGTAGQRVSLGLSANTMCVVTVTLRTPDGTPLGSKGTCISSNFIDTMVLPVTGTYSIGVDPSGAVIGSVTLTLYDVPPDLTGTITLGGAAVPVAIPVPGQRATLTFSGTAGQRVFVQVGLNTVSDCLNTILLQPNGSTLASVRRCLGGAGFIDVLTLPITGTYSLVLDPEGRALARCR